MSLIVDPSMEDLPEPVMLDILSRLPVKKIIHCKCVCKKWRNIVSDSYFADLQLSRSPACFLIEKLIKFSKPGILKWVEVEDELNHNNFRHDPIMSLDLNLLPNLKKSLIFPVGSYNGLVCLRQLGWRKETTCICNPITREYMILPRHQHYRKYSAIIKYCFGAGSLTRKYKVIRILADRLLGLSEAEIYSLGTGQWRSLGHVPYYWFNERYWQFLNGHAHWTMSEEKICSFNFDNETFELFPSPPSESTTEERQIYFRRLGVLKGCLCLCDTYNTKLMVWVMKEYGIKKSWHKELVIEKGICPNVNKLLVQPICHVEGLKDGTILMEYYGNNLIVYCPRRKAIIKTKIYGGPSEKGSAYRPSFHRLQNFENESVHVFRR